MFPTPLTWDDTYLLAQLLRQQHPGIALEEVSLAMIYHWVIMIPQFQDDPLLVNDTILEAILQEWFEEANPL